MKFRYQGQWRACLTCLAARWNGAGTGGAGAASASSSSSGPSISADGSTCRRRSTLAVSTQQHRCSRQPKRVAIRHQRRRPIIWRYAGPSAEGSGRSTSQPLDAANGGSFELIRNIRVILVWHTGARVCNGLPPPQRPRWGWGPPATRATAQPPQPHCRRGPIAAAPPSPPGPPGRRGIKDTLGSPACASHHRHCRRRPRAVEIMCW